MSVSLDYEVEKLLRAKQELKYSLMELEKWLDKRFELFYHVKGYNSREELPNGQENPEFWAEWEKELYAILVEFFKELGINKDGIEKILRKQEERELEEEELRWMGGMGEVVIEG
jgi:hypothetical protein